MNPLSLLFMLGFLIFPSCRGVSAQEPSAQESPKSNSTKNHLFTAQAIAEQTLDAMRDSDVGFLSNLADPTGLYIGIDVSKMTASQFRKELSEKRGVYCVILDSSCIRNNGNNTQYSLRQVLIRQPVTVTIGGVQGAPEMKAAAVKDAKNPNEIL